MNPKIRGTICGILAAVSYGTNPLGALNLYADGLNTNSVIFYRYAFATLILAVMMVAQRKSFAVTLREIKTLATLGTLMVASSLTLFSASISWMPALPPPSCLYIP